MYSLQIANSAWRIFRKLPNDVKQEFFNKAQVLQSQPFAGESLKGKYRSLRSIHFGYKGVAYRLIYQVFSEAKTIIIRLADKRENIYRRLEEMKIFSV